MTYNPSSGGGSASWSSIAGKPSQFPPEAHTQAISTVTGLQSALDGKQAAGSYAAATHSHAISGVTGLQAALDGKQDVGGGGGSDPWTFVFLSSDSAVTTTAFGNTGNLSFAATAGSIYAVEVFGVFKSAATTTGSSMALDVPTGSSVIGYYQAPNSTTTSQTTLQIAGATTTAVTAASATANTNLPFYFMGTVSAAIDGTVQVMHRSEVAASAITVKAGLTYMRYRKIN